MSDFKIAQGFEEIWRPVAMPRVHSRGVLSTPADTAAEARAKLKRIVRRAPEVLVKVTGRTRDPGHLKAHLDYISRNGQLGLEDGDGVTLRGRGEVAELVLDWTAQAERDSRRRTNSPMSLAIVLSMPADTEPERLRLAARAFAAETFGDRFDYVFALHLDAGHPHIHLTVRALGGDGLRLNPKKADLEAWRQTFARALRERGVEAEATPRRARGVTRRGERGVVRRIQERAETGKGAVPRVRRAAYHEAAKAVFADDGEARPWEATSVARQARVRSLYLEQARILAGAEDEADRRLAMAVVDFVRAMPAPDSQRLALARELREANEVRSGRDRSGAQQSRDRSSDRHGR